MRCDTIRYASFEYIFIRNNSQSTLIMESDTYLFTFVFFSSSFSLFFSFRRLHYIKFRIERNALNIPIISIMRMSSQWIKYQLFRCECTMCKMTMMMCIARYCSIYKVSRSQRLFLSHRFMCHNNASKINDFYCHSTISMHKQSAMEWWQRDRDKMALQRIQSKSLNDIDTNTFYHLKCIHFPDSIAFDALNRMCNRIIYLKWLNTIHVQILTILVRKLNFD